MNPFRDSIVSSPWNAAPADISEIHSSVYNQVLAGLEAVRSQQVSRSLTIYGEAGSGKTHLLGRLRASLTPVQPIATDRKESLFVWVRLQTSPRMIWRTLRRSLVEDWFRPVNDIRSQIDRILFHRLAALRPAEWDLEPWYEYMLDTDPQGLEALIDQIAVSLNLDHNLSVAFQHIAFGRHRRELRAWLAGTSLADSVLETMGLAQEDGTEDELELHAREIVLMLCQLTGPDLPILLSFDQVEALERYPDDHEAMFAFGQLISTLHDATKNVLLVSCVQSAFYEKLKANAREADRDRLKSFGEASIDPLSRAQAVNLIAARRESAGTEVSVPTNGTEFWPLSAEQFEDLFKRGAVSPRILLNECAVRLDNFSVATPVPVETRSSQERIDAFLVEQLEQGIEHKSSTNEADRTEEIVQHGLPQVVELLAPTTKVTTDPELPDVSLIFETRHGRLGLCFCTQSNMRSLTNRLKRLKKQHSSNRLQRLVLIRDDRIPLTATAKIAKQCLTELEHQGVVTVFPQIEALAALDALRNLLSNAAAGDLSFEGETLSRQTVGQWLKDHLPRSLQDLADEVLGTLNDQATVIKSDSREREELNALLIANPVQSAEELAASLKRAPEDVIAIASQYPEHFGILGGTTNTLFLRTESRQSVEIEK